jgi:hypothetical protein
LQLWFLVEKSHSSSFRKWVPAVERNRLQGYNSGTYFSFCQGVHDASQVVRVLLIADPRGLLVNLTVWSFVKEL